MSTPQRIVALALAVVVLVGAFVLTSGGGDDEPRATATTSATPPEATATTAPETTAPAPPSPRVETVRVRAGRPVGEPRTISFSRGDTVRLRFRSDADGEVHIHGYDRYVQLEAGGAATARFKASAEGVFEVEEHGTGELLAKLEIRP